MTPSMFYGKLNSYFYTRKSIDFFEYKSKKGSVTPDDISKNKEEVAKLIQLESELYEACVKVEV